MVDELASTAAGLTKHNAVTKPFVMVDLRKWVPMWAQFDNGMLFCLSCPIASFINPCVQMIPMMSH